VNITGAAIAGVDLVAVTARLPPSAPPSGLPLIANVRAMFVERRLVPGQSSGDARAHRLHEEVCLRARERGFRFGLSSRCD